MLNNKTQKRVNRAAEALRISAATLHRSKSALGAFFQRVKSRAGTAKAVTATAHKIARYIYAMLSKGEEYVCMQMEEYEERYKGQMVRNMKRKAKKLGFELVPASVVA